MAFSSISAPLFDPIFPFDWSNSGVIFFMWVLGLTPQPRALPILDMVSTGSISPLLGILANIIPVGFWELVASLASGTF